MNELETKELETTESKIQELRTTKNRLDRKLADETGVMADLEARYTSAAQAQATGSKPKENPADVQALIDKQTIAIDGLQAAITECDNELQPLLAAMPELSRERHAQHERDELQRITTEALSHGNEILRVHDELQTHFAAFLSIEKALRARNMHSEATRILDALRARPNYFGNGVWNELVRIQPWDQHIVDNVQREKSVQEMQTSGHHQRPAIGKTA